MKLYQNIATVLLLICCFAGVKAQELPVKFLDITQGLSNNSVITIHQDANEFMWFGTYDGLNRYDGYSFKTYRNLIGDSTSIASNSVYCIQNDSKNNIWVGGSKGASVLNQTTDKFKQLHYMPYNSTTPQLLNDIVHQIKLARTGTILVASQQKGLISFNENSFTGKQITLDGAKNNKHVYDVTAIQPGDYKTFCWVYVNNEGICRYDIVNKKLKVVFASAIKANCFAAATSDNLWLGTDEGLFLYDPVKNSLSGNYMPRKINITNVLPDNGQLWIATDGAGVYNLYRDSKMAVPYDKDKGRIVKSNSVWCQYRDTRGNKWIGTLRGGISMISAVPTAFEHIKYTGTDPSNLINNFILSFCEDEKNNIWIGTDGAGLRYWDRKQNTYKLYNTGGGTNGTLTSNFITSIIRDENNLIWLSTWAGGINRINPKTGAIDYLNCYNPVTKQVEKNVWFVFQDSKKNIWAGATNEGALYKFNKVTNTFELFSNAINNLQCLIEDKQGRLWAGNYSQLFLIDPITKKHEAFDVGYPVRSVLEESYNNLWVGTQEGGLLLFDRKSHKFTRYTTQDGLSGNTVLRLLQDREGYLWMSTYNGLTRFDVKTKTSRNFTITDGLQGNQFSFNAGLQLSTGEFLFGGINGFNIFFPERIKSIHHSSKIQLTSLSVNNSPIEQKAGYITPMPGGLIKDIRLPFDETTLSIEFAEIDYNNSDNIDYAYTLEGWDDEWNYVDNARKANYTRLHEGDYTFKVKTKNADGTWNKPVNLLQINVMPPWYRTIWAYLLYSMLVAAGIYAYIRYSRYKEQLRYSVKLAQMESRKEKELAEKQLSMFTYISHELRTPLSLIINPLKRAVRKPVADNPDLPNDLAVAHRNARRLLSLVDQLLLLRKAESDADSLKISPINLTHICNEVYECFVNQAKGQSITFNLLVPETPVEIYGDYEKIEIALFNLTSNAFKYTTGGGTITLQLSENDDEAAVSIIDTGKGIAQADIPFIFEKFRQLNSKSASASGFGIGLYIVKYFIEKHKGTVSCSSEPGKGSTFTLNFLKGNEHFAELPISEVSSKMSELVEELMEEKAPHEIEVSTTQLEKEIESQTSTEILTGKKSVLIIDDNDEIREYLVQLFSPLYLVYSAINGIEGLENTIKHLPDLVISDIAMDGMDGLEVCQKIKENNNLSHIPVILLTATTSSEIHLQGITFGADDYITKPFDSDILMARVETLLKSRENLRSYFLNSITLKENNHKVPAEYQEFLTKCIRIIEANLDDKDFTIKSFSKAMGMSHRSLYDKIKLISGQTLNAFIRSVRLRRAALLMLTEDINIAHASAQVGFEDQQYFRQQFVKLFGMNPSDYIRKYKSSFNRELNVIK
ncbi:hybrid sensor histidine kinase/response regulator transcription factor [Flavobacterium zepuense]|nr:hybrid sensor histidine kinase/response regulator transcription factor [Flavobacterium zepuense]